MTTKSIKVSAWLTGVLLLAIAGRGQTSSYSNAVMSLHPAAYWPLQETTPPPAYDIETNYGSLGSIANAYYASTNDVHGQVGAIAGDSDTSVRFLGNASSFAIVPTTDNRVSLPAAKPFTVECWVNPITAAQLGFRGILTQTGPNNAGGINGTANSAGWSLNIGFAAYRGTGSGNGPPCWSFHVFNGVSGFTGGAEAETGNSNWLSGGIIGYTNTWTYLCGVFDGTNCSLYAYSTNMDNATFGGTNAMYLQLPIQNGPNAPVGGPPATIITNAQFSPDTWDPIMFGCTRGLGANPFPGYMDEVAIYTNALTGDQIANHFTAGTNGLGNYSATILADSPSMYWRMNASQWTNPPASSYPVAMNYGTAASTMSNPNSGGSGATSAVYQPGTVPGVMGPTYGGFGTLTNACAFNGLVGAVDAGYSQVLDPRDATNNFSLVTWFKGNPMDFSRFEVLASHSDKSWKAQIKGGSTFAYKGIGGQATIPPATFNVNDGKWHMYVMESVYNPGVNTNVSVFLDGSLISATVGNPSPIPGTNGDAWIGGAIDYTQPTNEATYNGNQQYFAGAVSHVAYFTNALTLDQINTLYVTARPEPQIFTQPQSGVAGVGGAFTNAVAASGQQPLFYLWYKDNAPLGNQTNASLVLNPVQPGDQSTNYFVIVTNNFGAVTSSMASLTVISNLAFVGQFPITYTGVITLFAGTDSYLGSTPTFKVSAVGAVPISYQWRTNGVAIAGATSSSFTITNAQMTSPTNLDCVAVNSYGSLTSMVWSVSYVPAPTAPFPQAVLADNPIGYWRLNEPDDGAFDGNGGAICNDYQSGNNGIYTNVYLSNATFGTGYSPATDPTVGAAEFGVFPTTSAVNCDANFIGSNNIDFSVPLGGNGAFTVAVWANGNSLPQAANVGLVTKGYSSGEEFTLDEGSVVLSTGLRFYVRDALANGYDASSAVKLANDSRWHLVVGVCDAANGGTSLYVDGVLVASAKMAPGVGIINSASVPLIIGSRGTAANPGGSQFRGLLNEVSVYKYAMSANQIAGLYSAVGGTIAPYLVPPLPSTNLSAVANGTLTIPATAVGTPPMGYYWTNVTTGATLAAGVTNGATLNATLSYANVPSAWNKNQLQLVVTNAYGTTNIVGTLTVGGGVNTNSTNILFSVAGGNQLTLSWPADHTGWTLQAQTNSLTGTNWVSVANSGSTNQVVITIDPTNGSVFYRMVYP